MFYYLRKKKIITGDPAWANTALLMHMDGNLVDVKGKTITNSGVSFSSAIKKFGTHSASFGYSSYFRTPSAGWNFAGDFTVESWVYSSSWSGWSGQNGDVHMPGLWCSAMSIDHNAVYFGFGPVNDGTLGFAYFNGSGNTLLKTSATIPVNVWNHIALSKQGSTLRLFINGGGMTPGTLSRALQPDTQLLFGRWSGSSANGGYVDEFRITTGVARYTAPFAVPTAAFPNAA